MADRRPYGSGLSYISTGHKSGLHILFTSLLLPCRSIRNGFRQKTFALKRIRTILGGWSVKVRGHGQAARMSCFSTRTFFLLLLGITGCNAQESWRSVSGRANQAVYPHEDDYEWTTWFNVDHPGGKGDYEKLNAIRFYYRTRVCEVPRALEARTTEWIPARTTGERVHADPTVGFWCVNAEQFPGKNCSNYAVRFLCPKDIMSSGEVSWGPWSDWSVCPAQCDLAQPSQHRSRSCKSTSQLCHGKSVESRSCPGSPCPRCELQCVMGRVNEACDGCFCQDHVVLGSVRSAGGLPAPGAAVLHKAPGFKLLTVTDHNGHFQVRGICPDGNTTLLVKLKNHTPQFATVPRSSERTTVLLINLERAKKLYVLKNPENKARREGQTAAFCCKIDGTPQPDHYEWFHNGSLLDLGQHQYNQMLILKNLSLDQMGEYHCRASNENGAVKSKPATLTIIGQKESSCDPKPDPHLIRLPHDCFQNDTDSFYYDVGRCPTSICTGKQDNSLRCKDSVSYCCGISNLEKKEIQCRGYLLPIMVVTQCGCKTCVDTKAIVRGRAIAADTGEPMRFGHIYMDGTRISRTGYKGTFSIQVPTDTERLVLTFVDNMQKFVNTTKVLPFNAKGGAVFHEIKLLRKKPAVIISSRETNKIDLGEVEGQDPMAEIEIPPNAFYKENGEVFMGDVKASVTFLDPRDVSTAAAAQSDLNFIGGEGDTLPLRTYGMFSVDFRDEEGDSLNAGEVKVRLDAAQVKVPEHLKSMKLWSLNPGTGMWEEEGTFQAEKVQRGKREERTFLIGNMEIRERRLFNLDVPENRRCYVKVRAFRSDRYMPSEQSEGVVMTLINMEPTPGFSTNPRAWGRFDSVITGSNGACLPAFCDEQKADAYSAYVMANLGGEELEAVPSSPKLNPNTVGVPQPYLNKLNYRRSDHDDPRVKKTAFSINIAKPRSNVAEEANGPVYSFEKLKECEEAPFSAAHFRFSRVEGDRYDYNTVPFNEDDPMSWTEDYLSWWPKPMEYRACYVKVKLNSAHELNVRSRNMGGTHPKTVGQLYGIRDTRSIRDMDQPNVSAVCLEFKCSGMLYDQDRVDRTLVKVMPQGSCKRDGVNGLLQEYLVNHLPLAVNNDTNEFTMLAPLDPLGHNYGIYTVTDQDPRTAKEIALGRCFDGTSDGTSRVMKSNEGVALTFTCGDKEVTRQSVFQQMQNSLGQATAGSARQGGRGNRRQRGGSTAPRKGRRRSARDTNTLIQTD